MDHVKLSGSINAHVLVVFKIIIKFDYLEKLFRSWSSGGMEHLVRGWKTLKSCHFV